jgi:hypothetical protein
VAGLAILLQDGLDVFVEGDRRGIRHHHDARHAGDNDGCCSKDSGHLFTPTLWRYAKNARSEPNNTAAAVRR